MEIIPNESHPLAPNGTHSHPLERIEANGADTDTDTDTDTVTVTDNESECDCECECDCESKEPSTKLMDNPSTSKKIHKDFEPIAITFQALAEEDDEFPYTEEAVERFYEVNEERGWLDGSGEEITDIIKWYKQFCYTELPNGHVLAEFMY